MPLLSRQLNPSLSGGVHMAQHPYPSVHAVPRQSLYAIRGRAHDITPYASTISSRRRDKGD